MNKIQLKQLWISSGGNPAAADTAAAIALAESTGKITNVSKPNTDGSRDHGLWQINDKAHPNYDVTMLLQPTYNAKAAVSISNNGTNWQPWTTYKTGAYKKFTGSSGGGVLDTNILGVSPNDLLGGANDLLGGVPGQVVGGVKSVADVIGFIGSGTGMTRILKVAGGGIIVLLAINELIKAGNGGTSPAPKVVPIPI